MKIHKLRMRNFRKFSDYTFRFHPEFTVLIGNNASGKSSILDALSVMLGTYLLRSQIKTGRTGIYKDEARLEIFEKYDQVTVEQQKPTFLHAEGVFRDSPIEWKRSLGDRGKDAKLFISAGEEDIASVRNGEDVTLPVFQYYGTGRLWDRHRKIPVGRPDSRTVGYRNCFDPKSDHHLFEKWFKQLELSALQKNKDIGVLEAVRNAVKICVPGAKYFYYDVANDGLMIELDKEGYCLFSNLSDGYRNMVAMVADITHRAARLNPHLGPDAARKSFGVVMIDEIDLHLHPKWQRRVVGDLKKAFPNIQFIVTTHSPFILQSLETGEVIDLNAVDHVITDSISPEEGAWPGPGQAYSHRSIEDIIEEVMGVDVPQRSRRYQEMYETAMEYYKVLEEAQGADFERKEELKRRLDELSAPFSENMAYHAFLEMKRISAGMGHPEEEDE